MTEYENGVGCAVIGGVVVRDPRQGRLDGGYLFGDACSDNLWLLDPAGDDLREAAIVAKMGRSLSCDRRGRGRHGLRDEPRERRAAADLRAGELTADLRRSGTSR